MAIFLNKKEQVYDLKLTSYGKRLLSNGTFKPVYYAFYDDNVLYDGTYAGITESQNDIHKRIKQETQYLESLVHFKNIDNSSNLIVDEEGTYYESDITPSEQELTTNNFKIEAMIGDAYLEADTNIAPAWKVVSLNTRNMSSTFVDAKNDFKIPQINIELNYIKEIVPYNYSYQTTQNIKELVYRSESFKDGNMIRIVPEDLMLYIEELNTTLLTENFDIEVFNVVSGSPTDIFERKYFPNDYSRFNGEAIPDSYTQLLADESFDPAQQYNTSIKSQNTITTASVEYYFTILKDGFVDKDTACKANDIFNKQSYYIDLDFDCVGGKADESIYVDIYGAVTEPEICQ